MRLARQRFELSDRGSVPPAGGAETEPLQVRIIPTKSLSDDFRVARVIGANGKAVLSGGSPFFDFRVTILIQDSLLYKYVSSLGVYKCPADRATTKSPFGG